MKFGWGDVGEGAVCTTKYTLHSKHPLKQSVSFSSRGYSIYSFAQPAVLGQRWGKELWMLALGFPLFSFPFPFLSFYSKTCRIELCMVRSWICFFHVFVSIQNLFQRMIGVYRVFCGAHFPFVHIFPSKVHSWSCLQGTF